MSHAQQARGANSKRLVGECKRQCATQEQEGTIEMAFGLIWMQKGKEQKKKKTEDGHTKGEHKKKDLFEGERVSLMNEP
jgi:hypothetical protein